MARRTSVLILFGLCFSCVLCENENATTASQENSNSALSASPNESSPTISIDNKNNTEDRHPALANLEMSTASPGDNAEQRIVGTTSTFPPFVHNANPDSSTSELPPSNPPAQRQEPVSPVQEIKTTESTRKPQSDKSQSTSTEKPNSSNTLRSNLVVLFSMILMWKFSSY